MSRYQAYSEYKDSEAIWLGEIPADWNLYDGKRLFSSRREAAREDDEQLAASQKYGVIPQKLMMELNDAKVMLALKGTNSFRHVDKNNFVISLRSFEGGIEHSSYVGCVSPAYTVLRSEKDIAPGYYKYLLKSSPYVSALQASTDSLRDGKSISYEQFGAIPLPYPQPEVQSVIASFLDYETAKIDALIEKQQRLIELLKERRQAVISHAVTKGLNPNAPMKESGVEWLGEVPAHWGTTYLKYATSMIVDCPHETPVYSEDGQYLVIRTADLNEGNLDSSKMYRVQDDEYIRRVRRADLKRGDIIYGREGERWGHAGLVPESARYCLGQRIMQFRAGLDFSPDFLMWLLNSDNVYKQGQLDTVGATSPHVNVSTIRNFSLTQPPLLEQKEIGRFLNEKSRRIDELIDKAVKTISLLQERRTALISAAVTGKIDVRDWQAAA